MDILETMKARHSVRQYKNQAIESSKREKINALIKDVNAESKLSIQVFYDEPKCFDSFMAHYGKFENVKNYIAIVGNKYDFIIVEEKLVKSSETKADISADVQKKLTFYETYTKNLLNMVPDDYNKEVFDLHYIELLRSVGIEFGDAVS